MKKNFIIFCLLNFLFFYVVNSTNSKPIDIKKIKNETINYNLKPEQTFFFGNKESKEKGTHITSQLNYNNALGYGFDTACYVSLKPEGITSKKGFCFSVKLTEGNYKIKVGLGNNKKATNTTIKAESRRLILKELQLKKGVQKQISFNLNLRSVNINKTSSIQLKTREKNTLNWDDNLSLEFLGEVVVQKIEIEKIDTIKTLFLAGDSTVADQDVIEFGYNDQKQEGKGDGPSLSYTNLLIEYITEIRKKGGIPILATPTQRRLFNNKGKLIDTHGEFPEAMRKVAKDFGEPLIDLTKKTTTLYESWGKEGSKKAFVHYSENTFPNQTKVLKDNTHFNSFGANEIAGCIVKGVQDLNLTLKKYLKQNVTIYNPKKPHGITAWTLPMSLRYENIKPDGNL